MQCDVRVVHVDPVADAGGHGLPLFYVTEHAVAAFLVECLDAVFFNLFFAFEAKRFLDLELHGQAVGVPAAFALDAEALHGSVTADDVFEDPGEGVVDAGAAVGRGRALVHHEKRCVGAFGLCAPEDVFVFPVL